MSGKEDVDEFCDPKNPRKIKFEDVLNAVEQLRLRINYTPCRESIYDDEFGMKLYFKQEIQQRTGSFKERGILYALMRLSEDKRKRGVIIASLGNAALALCYHGEFLRIPFTIVMPSCVPMSKLQKCRDHGGKVLVYGTNLMEADKYARFFGKSRKLTYINSRDYPDILAGYGTIALEILEQVPLVKAVLVPVGCGGLAAAVATVIKHVKPKCLVYGIQTESMPVFFKSLDSGEPKVISMQPTIADGIAVPHVGVNSLSNAQQCIDKMLLVNEDWIARAVLHLAEKEHLVVEGAGACPLAAVIGHLVPELKSKSVVCVLSGGNVDNILFSRYLNIGLAGEGRLVKFWVKIKDSTTAQVELFKRLVELGHDLVTHLPDHRWVDDEDTHRLQITIVCTAKDLEHALELKRIIEIKYPLASCFETDPFKDRTSCACYVRELDPQNLPKLPKPFGRVI